MADKNELSSIFVPPLQEYYQRMEAKLAEEEYVGDRMKKEPPKLTTPYVSKNVSYIPGLAK